MQRNNIIVEGYVTEPPLKREWELLFRPANYTSFHRGKTWSLRIKNHLLVDANPFKGEILPDIPKPYKAMADKELMALSGETLNLIERTKGEGFTFKGIETPVKISDAHLLTISVLDHFTSL